MLLRPTRRMLPVAVALLAGSVALPVAGAGAATYKRCTLTASESRNLGATYITHLKARGTSCANARRVVKSFNACRRENGGKDGRCSEKVRGYSCTEKRPSNLKTPLSYDADVVCSNGSRRVKFHYQQNT